MCHMQRCQDNTEFQITTTRTNIKHHIKPHHVQIMSLSFFIPPHIVLPVSKSSLKVSLQSSLLLQDIVDRYIFASSIAKQQTNFSYL